MKLVKDIDNKKLEINKVSDKEAEEAFIKIFQWIGENPSREGLLETPKRIVSAFKEYFKGYHQDPKKILEKTRLYGPSQFLDKDLDFENDSLDMAVNGTDDYIGFEDAADTYSGTSGGDIANYSMGIISMERGDFETAIDYFSQCDFEDVMVGSMCIGLQGDCNVEIEEYEKATELFEKAAAREVNAFTSPMYLKKAGLTYEELGQYEKAIVAYTKIKNEFPQSSEGADIDKFIARATK